MKVHVIFNFPDITDPDSPEADEVIDVITSDTVELQSTFPEALKCEVWVEDATQDVK